MYRPISLAAAVLASLALVGAASAPARAAAPAAAVAPAEPLVLVRPGDRQLSCTDLAAEINGLAMPRPAVAAAEKPKKKGGLGFLKVLSFVPIVGGVAGVGGMVASSVAGAAASTASSSMQDHAEAQMDHAMQAADAAMAGPSLAEQRKARLVAIFEEKGC